MFKITPDKWKHFYVGIILGAAAYASVYYLFHFRKTTVIAVSLGIVVTASYVFELFSKVTGRGHYEIGDAIAGIIGGATGILVVLLLIALF